jgi:hypothetical protein
VPPIQDLEKPKLAVVIRATIRGVGLDFMKEKAAPAKQPQIKTTGTKLLFKMFERFVTLVFKPASGPAPTAKTSGEPRTSARAMHANKRRVFCLSSSSVDRLIEVVLFIDFSFVVMDEVLMGRSFRTVVMRDSNYEGVYSRSGFVG